jgi:hypothetical protein
MIAGVRTERSPLRKVRAPQGKVLGNTQWGEPQGKCNREIPPITEVSYQRPEVKICSLIRGIRRLISE